MGKSKTVEPMEALMDARERLGLPGIAQMPGSRWDAGVGPWHWTVNASLETIKTTQGDTVPPFNIYITFNGWPWAVLEPDGSGQCGAGEAANPETFAAALAAWDGQ